MSCPVQLAWAGELARGPKASGIASTAKSRGLLAPFGVLDWDEFPLPFLEPVESLFPFPFPFPVEFAAAAGTAVLGTANEKEGRFARLWLRAIIGHCENA